MKTLPDLLGSAFERFSSDVALRWKEGDSWRELTYRELAGEVESVARGLVVTGVKPGESVCILSGSSSEWVIADLAILWVGAVSVPVYATSSLIGARYVFQHSDANVVVASDGLLKLAEKAKDSSQLLLTCQELRRTGGSESGEELAGRRAKIGPGDVAMIMYTSGTTGESKGVMLTHANILSNMEATLSVIDIRHGDRTLSFLPLSHALEHTAGVLAMLSKGVTISFAQDVTTVARDLLDVRPTVLVAVPRLLEKFYAKVMERTEAKPKIVQRLFGKAIQSKRKTALLPINELLFFRKIRKGLGGAMRMVVSGGAPLPVGIGRFFETIGLPVVEGYGLTETSPIVSANLPGRIKVGTVGPPIPGVEIKTAPDGEILVRGPNVMKGYYKDPSGTAQVIDAEGWFVTGDIGEIDSDGYLRITDRKKDLIVTSGGKKVAPQPIESELLTNSLINQVALVGNRRNHVAALIVPNFDVLYVRARNAGVQFSSNVDLVANSQVRKWYDEAVSRVNEPRGSYEQIKRFRLLPAEWNIGNELTPTMKVRRKEIEKRYEGEIEELYKQG